MNLRHHAGCTLIFGLAATPLVAGAQQDSADQTIEEVVVTGTYIRRQSQFDSPSPLVTVGRDDIDALGVNEIGDVIEDLTINTGSQMRLPRTSRPARAT